MDQPTTQPAVSQKQLPGIENLMRRTWDSYRPRWLTFAAIMLVPGIISWLATGILLTGGLVAGGIGLFWSATSDTYAPAAGGILVAILLAIVGFIILVFVQAWGQAALLYAATREQEKTDVGSALRGGWRLAGPVFWVSFITGLIVVAGFILFFIPGVIWAVWYSLALVVCVVEGAKGMDALRKSKSYVSGYWWSVLGRFAVLGVLWAIVNGIVTRIFGQSAGQFMGFLLSLVATPFFTLYTYNVYRDLKAVKSGAQ